MTDSSHPDSPTTRATFELVQAVPPLRPILEEHAEYHEEVLPFVVWSQFRDALVEFIDSGDDVSVRAFLDVVERLAGSTNEDVRNLVAISLLEDGVMLSGGRESAALSAVQSRFGPATIALLAETKDHYAGLVGRSRQDRST